MIYRKDANFPYPVLSNTSDSYELNNFTLDVDVSDDVDHYYFNLNYEIESEFIQRLLKSGKAQLILIIQTKDNKFYRLKLGQTDVAIRKSRISLKNRTSIQLHIQALEDINFVHNEDLNNFYLQFKDQMDVEEYSLLGYSNVVVFEGSIKEPFKLFERKLDENLNSDIKLDLGQEKIVIHYKNPEYQFNDLPKSNALNNAYIYADRKSTRLNSSHVAISYAVFCLKKKKIRMT